MPDTDQALVEADAEAPKRIADYTHLSQAELGLAVQLSNDGLTQTQIAQRLGCSQSAVSRALNAFGSTTNLAKLKAHNKALAVTEATIAGAIKAALDGKAADALELLDRIGVVEKRQAEKSGNTGVMVVIQQGSVIPGIDLSVVPSQSNVIANYQTHTDSECQSTQALTAPQSGATGAKVAGRKRKSNAT